MNLYAVSVTPAGTAVFFAVVRFPSSKSFKKNIGYINYFLYNYINNHQNISSQTESALEPVIQRKCFGI